MTKQQLKRAGLFILVLILSLALCQALLFPFSEYDTNQDMGFYDLEENSIDVAVIGTSLNMIGFSPLRLYDQTGITSHNRANSCQSPETAWLVVKETLETQKPKVLIVGAGALIIDYDYEYREPFIRRGMDYRKWSKDKLTAVKSIAKHNEDDSVLSFIFPLIRYHANWPNVIYNGPDNWFKLRGYDNMHGQYASFKRIAQTEKDSTYFNEAIEYKVNGDTRYWYGKIFELCKENNVEVLLVANKENHWRQAKHDAVAAYAEEMGLNFIDYNMEPLRSSVGLDFTMDYYDSKHVNVNGSFKYTDSLGAYLQSYYGLGASNISEATKKQWEEDVATFKEKCANNGLIEVKW